MLTLIIHWIFVAITFVVAAYLVPGFVVQSFTAALVAALIVGVLNIIVWPILVLLTLPLTVITFGLFLFVVNALVLKLGAAIVPGFEIIGFWPAIFGALVMTLVGWLTRFVFAAH